MADRECTDRVKQWAQLRGRAPSSPEEVAEYAATVRREALEEAAQLVAEYPTSAVVVGVRDLEMAAAIRALMPPKEPSP